jgi:hypothetical protein
MVSGRDSKSAMYKKPPGSLRSGALSPLHILSIKALSASSLQKGRNLTPPAEPFTVSIMPRPYRSVVLRSIAISSLKVDFAQPNCSVNSLSEKSLFGLAQSSRIIAAARSHLFAFSV